MVSLYGKVILKKCLIQTITVLKVFLIIILHNNMKPEQKKRTVIIGIFIFLAMIILMAGVLTLGNKRRTFTKTFMLKATFDNVNGLMDGNNIWCAGVRIGIVKKVELISNDRVDVEMKVDERS